MPNSSWTNVESSQFNKLGNVCAERQSCLNMTRTRNVNFSGINMFAIYGEMSCLFYIELPLLYSLVECVSLASLCFHISREAPCYREKKSLRQTGTRFLLLGHTHCVIIGEFMNLSEFDFLIYNFEIINWLFRTDMNIKCDNIEEMLSTEPGTY